jgi:hypothetical protein
MSLLLSDVRCNARGLWFQGMTKSGVVLGGWMVAWVGI